MLHTMLTTEVGPSKKVSEITPSSEPTATEKPVEKTPARDKAVGKRPLSPSSENSEAWKARFMKALTTFCEARNELLNMSMNNAEVEAAKVVTESAMNNAEESDERVEKALKDMNLTEISNNLRTMATKLYQDVEIVKEELAAAKMIDESAVKKAKEWDNRAEKAEKAIGRKKAALYRDLEVAKNEHMMNLCKVSGNYIIMMLVMKGKLYRDGEVAKEDVAAAKALKNAEDSNKRIVNKAEKLVEDLEKAVEESWKNAVDSIERGGKAGKALEDWKKALKDSSKKGEDWSKMAVEAEKALEDWKKAFKDLGKIAEDANKKAEKAEKALNDVFLPKEVY